MCLNVFGSCFLRGINWFDLFDISFLFDDKRHIEKKKMVRVSV